MTYFVLKKYAWLFLAITSIPIAFYFMYNILLRPEDQTGHGFGIGLVSLLWSLFVGANFIAGALCNKGSKARRNYTYALMYIPLGLCILIMSFYKIFKSDIDAIHPGWIDNSQLGSDGITFLIIVSILAMLGSLLIFFNMRLKVE